jgi:hypothetical protein
MVPFSYIVNAYYVRTGLGSLGISLRTAHLPLSLEPAAGAGDGHRLIHNPLSYSEIFLDPDVDIFVFGDRIFLKTGSRAPDDWELLAFRGLPRRLRPTPLDAGCMICAACCTHDYVDGLRKMDGILKCEIGSMGKHTLSQWIFSFLPRRRILLGRRSQHDGQPTSTERALSYREQHQMHNE